MTQCKGIRKGKQCEMQIDETDPGRMWPDCCSQTCYSSRFLPQEIPVTQDELQAGGTRADRGKARVDLIPPEVLIELGKLYEHGAKKYTPDNWRRGMDYSRMYGSLMRHLLKFWSGEAMDEEGFHHLDAVIWGAVGLRYFELHPDAYEGFDDRWPSHPLDFPNAHDDLPRDKTNRALVVGKDSKIPATVPIPAGFAMLRNGDVIPEDAQCYYNDPKSHWNSVPRDWVGLEVGLNTGTCVIVPYRSTSIRIDGTGSKE